MPDGNGSYKPYVVTLPLGMTLRVELASPHPTNLEIRFADGSGVKFHYSGRPGEKGTVEPVGTVVEKKVGSNGKRHWSPTRSASATLVAESDTGAYIETGEH